MGARVLVIAPYKQFGSLAFEVGRRLGLDVTVLEAVLDEVMPLLDSQLIRDADAIVTRGGTADVLRRHGIHAIDAGLSTSFYSVAISRYLARCGGRGPALSVITYGKEAYEDLKRTWSVYGERVAYDWFEDREGVERCLLGALQEGREVVIGGSLLGKLARQYGLASEVVSSPRDMVTRTMEVAGQLAQARAEKRALSARFRCLTHLVPHGLLSTDSSGVIKEANQSAENLLGGPVVGRPLPELLPLPVRVRRWLESYSAGRELAPVEWQVPGDRSRAALRCRLHPVSCSDVAESGSLVLLWPAAGVVAAGESNAGEAGDRAAGQEGSAARAFDGISQRSPAMQQLIEKARAYAAVEAPVLIAGETGTGKELLARAIHAASGRSGGPFVAVNCAAFPRELLESELFGYVEGAFTGARKGGSKGLFAQAHGGTLFLDEVGAMEPGLQAKLLRVLQDKEVRALGGGRPVRVDVRIISATNADLGEQVKRGEFRADLYYRLAALPLQVPPLRERRQDILPLIKTFLAQAGKEDLFGRIDADLGARLLAHAWPGNVRELQNLVWRWIAEEETGCPLHAPGEPDAGLPGSGGEEVLTVKRGTLDDMERQILHHLVRLTERRAQDKGQLAASLGISRTTLWRKLRAKTGT